MDKLMNVGSQIQNKQAARQKIASQLGKSRVFMSPVGSIINSLQKIK